MGIFSASAAVVMISLAVPQVDFVKSGPTGAPAFEQGVLSAPLGEDIGAAALSWAIERRTHYRLARATSLKLGPVFATRFGASVHLLQTAEGIEIDGSKLVVTVDAQRRVVQVASSLTVAQQVEMGFRMNEGEAIAKAFESVPSPIRSADGRPVVLLKRAAFEVGDAVHAGYLAHVKTLDLTTNWYVGLDATTGQVLFAQNRVHRQALEANIYPISPGGLDAGVGRTATEVRRLVHPDGGSMVAPNDGGFLNGTQLTGYNCCINENCQADAGPSLLRVSVMGFMLTLPICGRQQRASNDPRFNPAGTYQYEPVDPPLLRNQVLQSDTANTDTFAEVHAFYHANRVYDWMRGLSAGGPIAVDGGTFAMRDERIGKKPAVWANFLIPNLMQLPMITSLSRFDNALFLPREQFSSLTMGFMVPEIDTGVDTLILFQGNTADPSYDATVVQHEFGHGAIYATANITFDTVALDNRSANNEGGAMHEGFADYIAAAFNGSELMGPYYGPRLLGQTAMGLMADGYLRTLNNTFRCPDVLWGEVHQDAQHVSGALWTARQQLLGNDRGATFDAAFYAMLVSITPQADFAQAAMAMRARVAQAFPSVASAGNTVQQAFDMRGVTGCNKVMPAPLASPRPLYAVAAAPTALMGQTIPGPFQFRLTAPQGARQVRFLGTIQSAGGGGPFGGGMTPTLQLLGKAGGPIEFTRSGNTVTNDATFSATTTGMMPGNLEVAVPCGGEVYVTVAATAGGSIQGLNVALEPLTNCMLPIDAGQPDSGTTQADGGTQPDGGRADAGIDETTSIPVARGGGSAAPVGCGCSGLAGLAPVALALLTLRRRRR